MERVISISGIQTELVPIQRNELKGLNADMLLRFSFYRIVFNGQSLCVIEARNKEEVITPMKYKRITKSVDAVVGMPAAVLLEDSQAYYQRERLINQGVYFIVPDKYTFLPSLIVNAQLKKKKKKNRLTPVAQYVLLSYLLNERVINDFTIKELEKTLPYNYLAIARAVADLEDYGLCQSETDNSRTKRIRFESPKRELWENSQKYLSSPVKKILYSDIRPEGKEFSISGVNALSSYSHLNPEQYDTLAVWDKYFNPGDGRYNEIEGIYKIEVWRYPVSIPFQDNGKIVDKLSLYLSMKNDPDSRIEKELEIMIEEMKW